MSNKLIGEAARQERRTKHMEAVKAKSRQLLEQVFPHPAVPPTEESFLSGWSAYDQSLIETFGRQSDFTLAFKHGVNLINRYQKEHGWPFSPPSHLITNKLPVQLRSPKWIKGAWAFYDAYEAWRNEACSSLMNDAEVRYQSLMLSLMCDSGQCNTDVLLSFSQRLQEHATLPLESFAGYTFITLTLNNTALNSNDSINGEQVTTYQCYLSVKTLGQLRLWQKLNRSKWQVPRDSKALFVAITSGFQKHKHLSSTLNDLCSCSAYWYERHSNHELSEALLEYRVGRTRSYSLPTSNLRRLIAPTLHSVLSASFYNFASDVSVKPRSKNCQSNDGVLPKPNQFTRELKLACKPILKGKKISPQTVAQKLTELLEQYQFAPWQQAFVQWLIAKTHNCEAKTVNQYMLNQVKYWCLMNSEQPLSDITSNAELEDTYQEQINRHQTRKSQSYYAKRLKDLHVFAHSLLGLPSLGDSFFHIDPGKKHTRAGLIDEPLFKALLKHISELTDLTDIDKLSLQTTCIIAYRCGLRINELYKLQINNLENSATGWLEIRANRFGNNKTASGLRKVPLFPLLLKHEQTIVSNYLERRKALKSSGSAPLLILGSDSYRPFDTFAVSNYVGQALRAISGEDHLVFYHLRHSCFSRLHLMLERRSPQTVLPSFYPYSDEQTQLLRKHLLKQSLSNGYWEIAALAGHESPKTTFEHYYHLSDWLASPIEDVGKKISLKEAQQQELCSRRQYQEIAKQAGKVTLGDLAKLMNTSLGILCLNEQSQGITAEHIEIKLPDNKRISMTECYEVLDAISQGERIDTLVYKYRLSQSKLDQWLANANYLKSLTVNTLGRAPKEQFSRHDAAEEEVSRHFSASRQHALVPGKLKTNEERKYANKFVIRLRDAYPENKEAIIAAMKYCLTHTSVSKSGVTFNSPSQLALFIETFQFAIPSSHWRAVKLYINTSMIKGEWQSVLKELKTTEEKRGTKKGRSGTGSVRLELISPNEKQYTESGAVDKYSSHLLVYLMYMSFVMLTDIATSK